MDKPNRRNYYSRSSGSRREESLQQGSNQQRVERHQENQEIAVAADCYPNFDDERNQHPNTSRSHRRPTPQLNYCQPINYFGQPQNYYDYRQPNNYFQGVQNGESYRHQPSYHQYGNRDSLQNPYRQSNNHYGHPENVETNHHRQPQNRRYYSRNVHNSSETFSKELPNNEPSQQSGESSRGFIVGGRYVRKGDAASQNGNVQPIPNHGRYQMKGSNPQNTMSNQSHKLPLGKHKASNSEIKESTTQRERLVQQLIKGDCECLVCCEAIRVRDQIWNCSTCYHVFHLRCIKKWAYSSTASESGSQWRCPACQNITDQTKFDYYCFCGKCKNPEVNMHYTPHSCAEVCDRSREIENCPHTCTLLCHPGPCPPCSATVNRSCECGKIKKLVTCSQMNPILCDEVCDKPLNCKNHHCKDLCHSGSCKPCSEVVKQSCYCLRAEREVPCDVATVGCFNYSCDEVCGKELDCQQHFCSRFCHPGECEKCSVLPEAITLCPCGQTLLEDLYSSGKAMRRISCTDPISVCGKKCNKVLNCGPKDNPHKCVALCHVEECLPCPLTTTIKCRCAATSKEFPCTEVVTSNFVFHCERRCNKRKDCGRHKCLNHCCIHIVHRCELVCNKKLSCGNHLCPETCHGGNCPPCWNVSFDELRCLCGSNVIYPPVPCGKKPPECKERCTRSHPCDHKVTHTCHSEESCPPCTAFTEKWCFGHHELRSHIQCFLDGISCGKYCDKPLPCGFHSCKEICHAGRCLKSNTVCTQLCVKLRPCEHPCSAPCHEGPCPEISCKTKVNLTCPCGNRKAVMPCHEQTSNSRLISATILASKMQDIKAGESVNLSDIIGKKNKANKLQCNEECAVLERNRRLAIALQIKNPELSCKPGAPNYSDFLKDEAKKNLKFVSEVYNKFTELVQLAKQSKQKSRSHAFPPMNRDHRRVIHEMAAFFGCETQCYDEEPMKNVAITAFRDKSYLPFVSITTVVEREMGIRRRTAPVVVHTATKATSQSAATEKKEKPIDYFDYCG